MPLSKPLRGSDSYHEVSSREVRGYRGRRLPVDIYHYSRTIFRHAIEFLHLGGVRDRIWRDAQGRKQAPRGIIILAAAAILLRLLLLLGRGDYLAFDEGWYLLLGRSLLTGDGYSLIGIPHVTLSPLFPILAGAVGVVIDSWVWGGRLVAAVASGLLVLPVWSIFRRLGSDRIAFIGAALVAVLPSMAPFVVPFWIGADLWVGAEPLLHLLLYTGIALWLQAHDGERLATWAAAGLTFGLAFLARPEAIVTWGLLGLATLVLAAVRRSPRKLTGAALMGIGFFVAAAPYWLYIHDTTGRWSLTGRGVAPVASVVRTVSPPERGGPAGAIEEMLWGDDETYQHRLYALDPSGLRLQSEYWGIYPDYPEPDDAYGAEAPPERVNPGAGETTGALDASGGGGPPAQAQGSEPDRTANERTAPSTFSLFLRSMGRILPVFLWPFVILGAVRPRSAGVARREIPVAAALIGTSLAIALLVAVDPRTQLFLVPLLALYAARGFALVEEVIIQRVEQAELRAGFLQALLALSAVVWLLGINGQRLYRSLAYGSPHHVVAEQNRAVAEELDRLPGVRPGPVASWHPSIAVYADRDWRVLPFADLPSIARYEQSAGAAVVVLSAYYPPDLGVERLDTRYLVLGIPRASGKVPARSDWRIDIAQRDSIRASGRIIPDL